MKFYFKIYRQKYRHASEAAINSIPKMISHAINSIPKMIDFKQ
jgi:hypothetical protein